MRTIISFASDGSEFLFLRSVKHKKGNLEMPFSSKVASKNVLLATTSAFAYPRRSGAAILLASLISGYAAQAEDIIIAGPQAAPVTLDGGDSLWIQASGSLNACGYPSCIEITGVNTSLLNEGIVNTDFFAVEMKSGSRLTGGFLNSGLMSSTFGTTIKIQGSIIDNGFVNSGIITSGDLPVDNPDGNGATAIEIQKQNDINSIINGNFINSGQIISRGSSLDARNATINGSFINTGDIISRKETIKFNSTTINGSFINRGYIFSITSKAVEFDSSSLNGDIVNEQGGVIEAREIALRISDGSVSGSLINAGIIRSLDNDPNQSLNRPAVRFSGSQLVINNFTNIGTITSTVGYGISNSATIKDLNNYQGETGSGGSALTYGGKLPTFYNMIAYGDRYGQLAVDMNNHSGKMTFGIFSGDSTNGIAASQLKSRYYENVVTGVSQSDYSNTFINGASYGLYNGSMWKLTDATYRGGAATNWDLVVSRPNTVAQASLLFQRNSIITGTQDYDCVTYTGNTCVSFQARYSKLEDYHEGAGVLTIAQRFAQNWRIGGFIDYRVNQKDPEDVRYGDAAPIFGAFLGYSQKENGLGLQAKAMGAVQYGSARFSRLNLAGSAQTATGRADLNSYTFALAMGYGFALNDWITATPYAKLGRSNATRDSYRENGSIGLVDDPLRFSSYAFNQTTGTAGLRLELKATQDLTLRLGVGYEHDFKSQLNEFGVESAYVGSFTVANPSLPQKSRGIASAGLSYAMAPNQQLILDGYVRDVSDAKPNFTVLGGYRVSFGGSPQPVFAKPVEPQPISVRY
jgi:hypothetical protein